jgi:hypothetical protein
MGIRDARYGKKFLYGINESIKLQFLCFALV